MSSCRLFIFFLYIWSNFTCDARLRRHHRKRRFVLNNFDELFCGESANLQSEFDEQHRDSNVSSKIFSTHFSVTLDNTICLKLQNIIHVFKYERFEQQYPIENSYTFSIPLIDTNCKCHCIGFGSNEVCNIDKYSDEKNCSLSTEYSTCYTKFHSSVSPSGCPVTSIPARACCQIKLKPFQSKIYRAVKLAQPINQLILSHSIYTNNSGGGGGGKGKAGMLKMQGPDEYRIILNKGKEQFEINDYHRILISLTAPSPNQQLRDGVFYFDENDPNNLKEGKVNEIGEGNLQKMGWFQKSGDFWTTPTNGLILRNSHSLVINNCKEQIHLDHFSGAKYFILRGSKYNETIDEKRVSDNGFIRNVHVDELNRVVTISHEHGTVASIFLKTDSKPSLTKSQSILSNFSGTISLDHDANRMLNLTFYGVKGTIHIKLYENDRKTIATFACTAQFGTTIKDDGSRISLPSSIRQAQFVCILADEQPAKMEICKWIPYEEKAMRTPRQEQTWSKGHSPCSTAECNGMTRGPSDWIPWLINFDYLQSHNLGFGEWAKVGLHFALIALVTLLLILILTKCLIPLACCSLSIPFKTKKGKS